MLIAGEAGVGKSRLVRALLEELPDRDRLVLRAQCVDLGDPGLPYLAMVDLVRAVRAFSGTVPATAALLEQFPVLIGLTDPNTSGDDPIDDSRRLQIFDAMAALLGRLGDLAGPVVVVVEDVQWLDSSSAAFLRFLLSRMTTERLAVIGTVRTDGLAARPGARQLLNALDRLPSVRRIDLKPFDGDEVAEYLSRLDAPASPELAAEVFRRTGGNAYYVQTLAASADDTGIDGGLPRALADLLVGRLDGLSDDVTAVVRAAAVGAQAVPDRLLRSVAGLSDAATDEALRVAVAEGFLVIDGRGFSFAHDLLRSAVYDDLLPGERARLHGRYAAGLEARIGGTAHAAHVAHHYAEAQDPTKLLTWSVRAAEEAMLVVAPAEALEHLEHALAAWPAVADPATAAGLGEGRLAIRAARAAGLAGQSATARDWASRAVELCDPEDDPVGALQARAQLAGHLVAVDAGDQAVAAAEAAVRLAEQDEIDEASVAIAYAVLARALLAARRADDARPAADRALDAARAAGAPGLEVDALTTSAFLDELGGDREAAAARLGGALRLARDQGELAAELRVHYMLASLHYYNGDVAASLPVIAAAMARVTQSGLLWSDPGVELRVLDTVARFATGDLTGSLAAAQATSGTPPDVAAARLAAVSCHPAVALGDPDAARRLGDLRRSWDVDPQVALVAGGCEADHLTWEGDLAGAVAVAERAQAQLDSAVGPGMYGGLWLSALGLAALADDAAGCRSRREDTALAAVLEKGEVLMRRVEGLVASGRGRPGGLGPEGRAWHARAVAEHARLHGVPAVAPWQDALDAFGYGHVYEQARCHWRLAEALVAAGDRDGARAHAEQAASLAEQMQAEPLRQAVAATIAGARLSASAGAESVFTKREQEIIALVAEGLTNREIGQRLFISEKTASVHLSNLMAKLNVSSRTEAVTVAQRRGLLNVI